LPGRKRFRLNRNLAAAYSGGMEKPPTTCGKCRHFDAAKLAGYGYCRAGSTIEERAYFLRHTMPCIHTPSRAESARKPHPHPNPPLEGEGVLARVAQ
jgi:hypothetical protein